MRNYYLYCALYNNIAPVMITRTKVIAKDYDRAVDIARRYWSKLKLSHYGNARNHQRLYNLDWTEQSEATQEDEQVLEYKQEIL